MPSQRIHAQKTANSFHISLLQTTCSARNSNSCGVQRRSRDQSCRCGLNARCPILTAAAAATPDRPKRLGCARGGGVFAVVPIGSAACSSPQRGGLQIHSLPCGAGMLSWRFPGNVRRTNELSSLLRRGLNGFGNECVLSAGRPFHRRPASPEDRPDAARLRRGGQQCDLCRCERRVRRHPGAERVRGRARC